MAAPKVAVIVGSLRKGSFNRQLANAVEKLVGGALELVHVEIGDLPLYNQDQDADFPAASTRFKQAIEAVDAVLFVTPEYNRSVPGGCYGERGPSPVADPPRWGSPYRTAMP